MTKEERKKYNEKYVKSGKSRIAGAKYRNTIKGTLVSKYRDINIRCNNPKNSQYKYYGGRGIKSDFSSSQEFVDFVINELKIDPRGLNIHRIDNNKGYVRGNIEFISSIEHYKKHDKFFPYTMFFLFLFVCCFCCFFWVFCFFRVVLLQTIRGVL